MEPQPPRKPVALRVVAALYAMFVAFYLAPFVVWLLEDRDEFLDEVSSGVRGFLWAFFMSALVAALYAFEEEKPEQ